MFELVLELEWKLLSSGTTVRIGVRFEWKLLSADLNCVPIQHLVGSKTIADLAKMLSV